MAGIFCSRSSAEARAAPDDHDGARRLPSERDTGGAGLHRHVGTSRVFGIDEVCGETLPDGSLRAADCPERNDAAPSSAAGTDFPKYKPEFAAKVEELKASQVSMDTASPLTRQACHALGHLRRSSRTRARWCSFTTMPTGVSIASSPSTAASTGRGSRRAILGDAVGRIEGDTLVVETVNVTDETWLTDNGAFHTNGLRVVERLRRVGDTIEYQATAHDPAVLAEPWRLPARVLKRSDQEVEEPPRCEERDLEHMVDATQYHDNPR